MKHWLTIVGVSVALAACGGDDKAATAPDVNKTKAVAETAVTKTPVVIDAAKMQALSKEAKVAIQSLGGTLKGETIKALKRGGPVNALSVYTTRAPAIAGSVSAENDLKVSRVSLKNRNPDAGKASAWQVKVLEDFESRKAAGEKSIALTYSEVVEHGGQQEFRFMKAIPTDKSCLACHGANISSAVQKKLTTLYPQDKATGYKVGDLHGAFVVVKSLN